MTAILVIILTPSNFSAIYDREMCITISETFDTPDSGKRCALTLENAGAGAVGYLNSTSTCNQIKYVLT